MNPASYLSGRTGKLAAAKDLLRIPGLWVRLGLKGGPPSSGVGIFRSPFRPDRHPSFSVFDDGRRFKDHGTGQHGDAVDFLRLATGLQGRDLITRFIEMAFGSIGSPPPLCFRQPPRRRVQPTSHPPADLSAFQRPPFKELEQISSTRNLSLKGLGLAAKRGFLWCGRVKGHPCWVVAEPDGSVAVARRLDGQPFLRHDGSTYKSHALTRKTMPLGLGGVPKAPRDNGAILLCEGEGDFLAAFHFMAQWGEPNLFPVAILGRSQDLDPSAARRLAGWRIRVLAHADNDEGGMKAARRWVDAIPGAYADAFNFLGLRTTTGAPVKDLNDCTSIDSLDSPQIAGLNPLLAHHPCHEPRLSFDHANRFRISFWGRIASVTPEGWPVVNGTICPF